MVTTPITVCYSNNSVPLRNCIQHNYLLIKQFMPWAIIFWTFSLIFCFSATSISATLAIESTRTRAPYIFTLSVSIAVFATSIFAFSILFGWPMPIFLSKINLITQKRVGSSNDPIRLLLACKSIYSNVKRRVIYCKHFHGPSLQLFLMIPKVLNYSICMQN